MVLTSHLSTFSSFLLEMYCSLQKLQNMFCVQHLLFEVTEFHMDVLMLNAFSYRSFICRGKYE